MMETPLFFEQTEAIVESFVDRGICLFSRVMESPTTKPHLVTRFNLAIERPDELP